MRDSGINLKALFISLVLVVLHSR